MKRKSLLIMLLVALFVPLAMNAQNVELKKKSRVLTPELEVKSLNRAISSMNVLNGSVQISNLESRNFNTMSSSNAMSGRGTRDVQYEMVTSELTDWSGNYIIGVAGSDFVYAFDGDVYDASSDYGYNVAGFTELALSNNTISDAGDAAILTFEEFQGYGLYTILVNDQYYLGSDSISGLKASSSLESVDYLWEVYWYSAQNIPILFSYSDGSECYGIVFYNENDGSSTYGGFSNYELSYSGSTFSYYYTGLFKETTSSGGSEDCDYEKVTASQSDWSGDYVITYVDGSTAYVLSGSAGSGTQTYGSYITATVTDNILANADVADYNVTIEAVTYNNQTKYTVKLGNNYLGYTRTNTSSNNYLNFATSIPTTNPQQYYWTIAYSSNTLTMTNVYNTSRVLKWNSSSPRFACYTSGQNAITLFKKLTDCEPATSCEAYPIPCAYGFEDASDFNCWTTVDCESCSSNSNMYGLYNNSSYAHNGSKLFIFSSYCGETDPQYLISPELSGVVNGVHVEFYYSNCSFSNAPESFQVGYSTTDNNISSFTWVDSKSNTEKTYQLFTANYMGQVKYVAVKYTSSDSYYLYLDDFLFEEAPSCLEPTNIVASNETTTSATISWTAGGSETEWDLYYTTNSSDVPSASTTPSISGITTNSQSLTGLNPATTYYVYLRSVCDGSESSAWSTPGIFNTECYAMTLPYLYGFEDGALSVCWTPIIASPVYMSIEISKADPRTGTYHLNLDRRTPDGIQIIVLPEVDGAYALNNCEVSFYAKLSNGGNSNYTTTGRTLAVGVMTDPDDASTFVQVGSTVTPTDSYAQYTFDLSSYSGNGQYIAIKHDESSSGNNGYTYIDDLEVTTTTPVIPVTSITADDVTVLVGETATITPTVLPADATNPAVTYTSNNTAIATVNGNVVTGVAAGNTTITIAATDGSGVTATINVTVTGIDVTGITASDVTVTSGETATISYTVAPNNASDQSVTFTSANTAIATVDTDGVVTGVAPGNTTITIASVSNPEVTATINVTVTPDPNAVLFTVNAPANAQPGQVITVEGVLAAPASGTYGGFTDLGLGIYYDATAFEYVNNSMTYGPVVTAAQQYQNILTPNTATPGSLILGITVYMEGDFVTAEGVVFSAQFTVLEGAEGEFTFTARPNNPLNFDHEGTPIAYEATPSTVVVSEPQTFTKEIVKYEGDKDHYYLIASPIGEVAPTAVENMISNAYDLYYFDQSNQVDGELKEWVNYEGGNHAGFSLEAGKGYLYANSQTVTLKFTGYAYTGEGEVTLAKVNDVRFSGWNLVGNPFAEDAYITKPFYTLEGSDTYTENTAGTPIHAMQGLLVVADNDEEPLTFSPRAPGSKVAKLNMNVSKGSNVVDHAIISFSEGQQLPKLQFRMGSTKVYMQQEGKDYAIVNATERGEMPVSFKAENNGTYTLSFTAEEVSFAYLHLIDNLTGNDVDLLETPSYSFDARTTDYASRFKLVFISGNTGNDGNFAFFSNGCWVIANDGEAVLQVVDLNGRVLSSEQVSGCVSKAINAAPGVYMLRLVKGDDMKVQKVVVK